LQAEPNRRAFQPKRLEWFDSMASAGLRDQLHRLTFRRMGKEHLESPAAARSWTKIEDYIRPLQRRSTHRLAALKPRTQPEKPAFLLTTLPFIALLGAMILLTAAIVVIAWPPSQPQLAAPVPAKVPELGTAPKGWLQEAQKQFH
jgi:hypothetical protein